MAWSAEALAAQGTAELPAATAAAGKPVVAETKGGFVVAGTAQEPVVVATAPKPVVIEDPAVLERRREDLTRALTQYTDSMVKLDKLLEESAAEPAVFQDVWTQGSNYVGRLMISRVLLLQAHIKGVRVGGSQRDTETGGGLLLPRSAEVASKAEDILKRTASGSEVLIVYGVISSNNVTLFDIRPIKTVAPP